MKGWKGGRKTFFFFLFVDSLFRKFFFSADPRRERERASTSCVMRRVDVIQCGAFSGANVRVTNVYMPWYRTLPFSSHNFFLFSLSLSLSIHPSILKRNLMMIEFKLLLQLDLGAPMEKENMRGKEKPQRRRRRHTPAQTSFIFHFFFFFFFSSFYPTYSSDPTFYGS
jgi:hypothetical protein